MSFLNKRFPEERIYWLCITVILLGFVVTLYINVRNFRQQILTIQAQIAKERKVLGHILRNTPRLDDSDTAQLKTRGLEDPINDITEDLKRHTELISYKARPGGTMQFYRVHILSPKWVVASFHDGRIRGEILLEYSVQSNGDISWRSVASHVH